MVLVDGVEPSSPSFGGRAPVPLAQAKSWRTGWESNPRCAYACGLKARPHRPLGAPVHLPVFPGCQTSFPRQLAAPLLHQWRKRGVHGFLPGWITDIYGRQQRSRSPDPKVRSAFKAVPGPAEFTVQMADSGGLDPQTRRPDPLSRRSPALPSSLSMRP